MDLRCVYRPPNARPVGGPTAWLTLTYANSGLYAASVGPPSSGPEMPVVITLNGERYEIDEPISVAGLLARLEIDPRRVAIEHNLTIIKRQTYPEVVIGEGDTLEIVNFVGGG
jgi:sulfur carrier protein